MKKIKILHVSETFAAGVYTYIKDICQYLNKIEAVDSYVIYSGKREDTNPEKFIVDFTEKTTLIEIEMEREVSPIKDLKGILMIAKQIKRIKPDVIHLHSSKAGVIGRIASLSYPKAKVYYTPNGYSFLRQDISKLKQFLFRSIEFMTNTLFGGVTIACGDTEFVHAQKLGKSLLVRNGVNIEEVYKCASEVKSKKFIVGTVGRLSPQKNPVFFNEIAKRFPNVSFVWIGDGKLKSAITSQNVTVTGWLKREEALKHVSGFSVYLQTSLWEGLPFTIIEAMALKRVVVASNVIGNKDAVADKLNGFLCDSVDDFEKAINAIQVNSNLRSSMEKQSFKRANELFNRNKNFSELYKIYINY